MIDAIKNTPIEYSKQSRDYQALAVIYTFIFNQIKMYSDEIKNIWTDDIDDNLLRLRSLTLNFDYKYNWNNRDLEGITNCFRYLVRTKRTIGAIEMCMQILARLQGLELTSSTVEIENHTVIIKLSENLSNLGVIEDVLRYILPAGFGYRVIKYVEVGNTLRTQVGISDSIETGPSFGNSEDSQLPISQDKYLWMTYDSERSINYQMMNIGMLLLIH